MPGTFIISLDFELFWGVRDQIRLAKYAPNLVGTRRAVPALLRLFGTHGIRATWATVGFLFFASKSDMMRNLPAELPAYTNAKLSPYATLASIGENEDEDPYHFGK